MNEIVFKTIIMGSEEKEIAEKIYNEAFPERERAVPFETFLQLKQYLKMSNVDLVSEGEQALGFMFYFEFEEYVYLYFFAVNSELRGGGYGSRIMRAFMERFNEKAIIGSIETPIPETSNYEQRAKRNAFYERLGIHMTPYFFGKSDEDMMTFVSSCPDDRAVGYISAFWDFLIEISKPYGGADALLKKNFYRMEDGKPVETSVDEWFK